jgi:hypothetical protein
MPQKKVKRPTVMRRPKVAEAALAGVDWEAKKISASLYLQNPQFCHDLTYWLRRHIAVRVAACKLNGDGWTDVVCWPGRGIFVCRLVEDDDRETKNGGSGPGDVQPTD